MHSQAFKTPSCLPTNQELKHRECWGSAPRSQSAGPPEPAELGVRAHPPQHGFHVLQRYKVRAGGVEHTVLDPRQLNFVRESGHVAHRVPLQAG